MTESALSLVLSAPSSTTWELDGAVPFQPDVSPPGPRCGSQPDAADGFSARVWQERLPHGYSVARAAAASEYDGDVLELFREWARLCDEHARALSRLRERLARPGEAGNAGGGWGLKSAARPLRRDLPYASANEAWHAVHSALAAQAGTHRAAADEMKRLIVAPLKEATAAAVAEREGLLRPLDRRLAQVRRHRAAAADEATGLSRDLESFHRAHGQPGASGGELAAAAKEAAASSTAESLRSRARVARDAVDAANGVTRLFEAEVQPQALAQLQELEERRVGAVHSSLAAFSSLAAANHLLTPTETASVAASAAALSVPADICHFAAAAAPSCSAAADVLTLPAAAVALARAADASDAGGGFWGWLAPVTRSLFGGAAPSPSAAATTPRAPAAAVADSATAAPSSDPGPAASPAGPAASPAGPAAPPPPSLIVGDEDGAEEAGWGGGGGAQGTAAAVAVEPALGTPRALGISPSVRLCSPTGRSPAPRRFGAPLGRSSLGRSSLGRSRPPLESVAGGEGEGESAAAAGGSGAGYAQEVLEEIKRFDATILEDINELLKASSGGVGMTEQEVKDAQEALDASAEETQQVLEEAARPDGDWFYVDCGEQPVGPVAPDALAAAAVQGALHQESWVFKDGTEAWVPAYDVPWLRPSLPDAPGAPPAAPRQDGPTPPPPSSPPAASPSAASPPAEPSPAASPKAASPPPLPSPLEPHADENAPLNSPAAVERPSLLELAALGEASDAVSSLPSSITCSGRRRKRRTGLPRCSDGTAPADGVVDEAAAPAASAGTLSPSPPPRLAPPPLVAAPPPPQPDSRRQSIRRQSIRRRSALFLDGPAGGSGGAAADEPSIKGSKMSSALQGAILSFDREAKLHKVRRQSSIDGATLGKALRKKELKRWATEPAMGNTGTDHIAGMLAKALLQRRAQSRVSVFDCDDDEAFDEE